VRRLGSAVVAVALGGLVPAHLAAQRFWTTTATPFLYYSTVDGWWLAGFFKLFSPIGVVERPEPYAASVSLDGGASSQGSFILQADAQAPAYWDGWRVALTLTFERANRLGYYGLGNASAYDADSITAARPYFYQVSRTNRAARLTVQRRIVGPLRALAGATASHTDFRPLPGETVFARDVAAGAVNPATVPFGDMGVRAGLVLDTRDNETDPHSGVVVEALYATGDGYRRATAGAGVYLRPVERLTIAARAAGERMTGRPPVAAQMTMESSERQFVALGGYRTLRGYYDGRFTGPGKLLGGVEARYALVWSPTIFELKLVGFVDAGRVFGPGEEFRVTTDGLHTSAGGALVMRLLRNTILGVGAGFSDEGWQLLFATRWSY
jgi:outer membrane protein assembly factor BamA